MITNIKIKNFRSISEAEAVFSIFNVMIGSNGAGKTTLISAIDLTRRLATGLDVNRATEYIAPMKRELFNFVNRSKQSEIEITLRTNSTTKYKFAYTVGEKHSENDYGLTVVEESLCRLDENGKDTIIYHRRLNNVRAINPKSKTGNLEDIPLTFDEDKLVLSSYSDVEVKEVALSLSSSKVLWLDNQGLFKPGLSIVSTADSEQHIEHSVIKLRETDIELYREAISVIRKIIPEFVEPEILDITKNFQKDNDSTSEDSKKPNKIKSYIVFWQESTFPQSFTRQSLSSGNRKIIELVFALYNCKNYSFLIGEEIENGLHFGRLENVIEVLKYLSKKLKVQLLFTTHSPHVLNFVSPGEVVYCRKDNSGSVYTTLKDTDEYKKIKDELSSEPTGKELFESGFFD